MTRPAQQTGHAAFRSCPLNAWFAAAWDYEVGRNLTPKTVANRPIVFYRTTDGRPVGLADACWHRLAPLSMGKLRGDYEVQCGYHVICFVSCGRAAASVRRASARSARSLEGRHGTPRARSSLEILLGELGTLVEAGIDHGLGPVMN